MIDVPDRIEPLSSDLQNALRQIESHLNRMQKEIWLLRNAPLEPRSVTGFHSENGTLVWDY